MIAERLKILQERISEKALSCGRTPGEITLIGVSKYQPLEAIKEAYEAGLRNFGENKAQELRDKSAEFTGEFNWHFIGHLQTNKVKYVIEPAEYIHSVESIKLASEIQKRAEQIGKVQKIFLEIKTSGEATKFGLQNKDEIFETAEFCREQPNLKLDGLMTMAPYTDDEEEIRKSFTSLRNLKDELNSSGFSLNHLSMGMSGDWELAVEEGATMLRIGTAIFGSRYYGN
ncbi:MAG: YggS family pyridoxal phosphate-dependent enzyme [Ignavibacteria bacterium]|nr:MAG: YggS family pyridoxal phosphate-dependent enzyme [Ignavibacteria bacterium]